MKKDRILITGAGGFIGRELVRQLTVAGLRDIIAVDINPSSVLPNEVRSLAGDINDLPDKVFKDVGTVIHLASPMGVEFTESHPIETMETIVNGTKKLLDLSVQNEVSHFILASSSEVYGDNLPAPFSEDDPVSPKSIYGAAKLAAEYLCKAFHAEHRLDYTILRIFNAYGQDQSDKFVIPRFINNALNGVPIEIYGTGRQVRSFCHVFDVVRYFHKLLEIDASRNKVYNVGDPANRISMHELAIKIAKLINVSEPVIRFVTPREHPSRNPQREVLYRVPNTSAIKAATGYQPMENFDQRLLEIIEQKKAILTFEGK